MTVRYGDPGSLFVFCGHSSSFCHRFRIINALYCCKDRPEAEIDVLTLIVSIEAVTASLTEVILSMKLFESLGRNCEFTASELKLSAAWSVLTVCV